MTRFSANVGLPDWPTEMMKPTNWRWFLAIVDWEWRDPRSIEGLLASGEQVPQCLVNAVESIRNNTRVRKSQQAVNAANITGADRMRIAAEISNRLAAIDVNRFNAERIAEGRVADGRNEMTKHVLADMKAARQEMLAEARDVLTFQSVNFEALEDMVRELRDSAKRWPNI